MAHYVCVTGGRKFTDRDCVDDVIRVLHLIYGDELRILHGNARGADTLAKLAALERGIRVKPFPADWDASPRGAGAIRNRQMADYLEMCRRRGHTVQVVAFRGGSGTADMVEVAKGRGIDVDTIL